jgi:hypothetical protein
MRPGRRLTSECSVSAADNFYAGSVIHAANRSNCRTKREKLLERPAAEARKMHTLLMGWTTRTRQHARHRPILLATRPGRQLQGLHPGRNCRSPPLIQSHLGLLKPLASSAELSGAFKLTSRSCQPPLCSEPGLAWQLNRTQAKVRTSGGGGGVVASRWQQHAGRLLARHSSRRHIRNQALLLTSHTRDRSTAVGRKAVKASRSSTCVCSVTVTT